MRPETLRMALCAAALGALFATVAIGCARTADAAPVLVDRDWYIDNSTAVSAAAYDMHANLVINTTGFLAADHTTFNFFSTTDGQFGVLIKAQGRMVLDTCSLQAGDVGIGVRAKAWTFWAKDTSYLVVKKCTFRDCGVFGDAQKWRQGVSVETSSAGIRDSNFLENNIGLQVLSGAAPNISGNFFTRNVEGIEATGPTFYLEDPNQFTENNYGVVIVGCTDARVVGCTFVDNTIATIRTVDSTVWVSGADMGGTFNGILANFKSTLTVSNSSVKTIASVARSQYQSTIVLLDCDMFAQWPSKLMADSTSRILVRVSVTFRVIYKGNVPIESAHVKVMDVDGIEVAKKATNETGLTPVVQLEVFRLIGNAGSGDSRVPFSLEATHGIYERKTVEGFGPGPNTLYTITFVDDLPPGLTVTSPTERAKYNSTGVLLKGTASDTASGLGRLFYTVNGGPEQALPAAANWEARIVLPEGSLLLRFVALDRMGNQANVTRSITVDITPPTTYNITPPNGSRTRAYQLLISGNTEPNAKVFAQDTELTVEANGSFAGNVNLGDEEGRQVVTLRLVDSVGNEGAYVLVLIVDRTPPPLTVETNPDYRDFPILNRSDIVFFGTSEPGARIEVRRDGALVGSGPVNSSGTWRMTVRLVVGENPLVVDAFDEAGNREDFEIISFLYDVTAPEITVVSPQSGFTTRSEKIVLKLRTEPDAYIWVRVNGKDMTGFTMPAHGEYEPPVTLSVGNNTVVVLSRDPAGNTNSTTLIIVREAEPQDHGGPGGLDMGVVAIVVAVLLAAVLAVGLLLWMRSRKGRA